MSDESARLTHSKGEREPWHENLQTALSDCGVQRAPRHPVLNYIYAIAAMLGSFSIVSLASYGIENSARSERDVLAWLGYPLLVLFVILVLSRIRNLFLRRAWQSSARSAEDEIKRDHSRRPILYLRSFGLDKHLAKRSWSEKFLGTRPFANAEQKVTGELRKLGPVIAIGRPDEKLPALGAARFYVAHDRWQEKVALIVQESQYVLWATGETEGLRWELAHLVENLAPDKIVLWAHPSMIPGNVEKRETAWTNFCNTLGSIFPKPLPNRLGNVRFFRFDKDWNPIPYEATSVGFLVPSPVSALRKALSIPPAKHPRLWMTWDIGRILIGIVVIIGIFSLGLSNVARQWGQGSLHVVDFWIGAIGFGLGIAMLVAGFAGLRNRRLKPLLTWSIVPVVAIASWLCMTMIASPMVWKPIEAERWTQFANDSSKVNSYLEVPARFRRPEAYPLIVESRRNSVLQAPAGSRVSFQLNDLIDEVESLSKNNSSLAPVKDSLIELQAMMPQVSNLKDLPREYFESWTKHLEVSKDLPDIHRSQRAREILNELTFAMPDGEPSKVLKAKLQALAAGTYPSLVEKLLLQTLRNPYDPNYEIRREVERLLHEVSGADASDASLKSVHESLRELKEMIPGSTAPSDLQPSYFRSWTKHLEGTKELSSVEKSKRANDLLTEIVYSRNSSEEIEALRPRLHALVIEPNATSN